MQRVEKMSYFDEFRWSIPIHLDCGDRKETSGNDGGDDNDPQPGGKQTQVKKKKQTNEWRKAPTIIPDVKAPKNGGKQNGRQKPNVKRNDFLSTPTLFPRRDDDEEPWIGIHF